MDDEHTEFDEWAAELYSRPMKWYEVLGALCFPVLIVALFVILAPIAWVARLLKRKS